VCSGSAPLFLPRSWPSILAYGIATEPSAIVLYVTSAACPCSSPHPRSTLNVPLKSAGILRTNGFHPTLEPPSFQFQAAPHLPESLFPTCIDLSKIRARSTS
jgi:hypothetical protein